MDSLMKISDEAGVPVVEDCSHAHGAKYRGRIVGAIGHVAAWSLQGSKPVSAGEGGVLATNDSEIFERACLAGQVNRMGGLDLVTEMYAELQPLGLGMKFRAHPLGIAIANVQLKKLEGLNSRRRAYIEAVERSLCNLPGLRAVRVYDGAERGGLYAFPIIHQPEEHRGLATARFIEALQKEGLKAAASPYGLLHRFKIFADGFDVFTRCRGPLSGDYSGYREGDFPATEDVFRRLIFLPVLSEPVEGAVDKVVGILKKVADRAAVGMTNGE